MVNIGNSQVSLNSGGKPISLLGGGLQFLNPGKGQRGNRGRGGRGEETKEGSRGRGRNRSDRGRRSRGKDGKVGGKERGKNSSSKGSVQAEAKEWIDWAEMPLMKNAELRWIVTNLGIYHQKCRKL